MIVVWLLVSLNLLTGSDGWTDTRKRSFPPDFMFGVATAAYQVEGAWNIDGKSESIWDRFVHKNPEIIVDSRNGDVASDSYHQWQRDVEMLREIGVDFYRFSISWSRVLPTGFDNIKNKKGLAYYDNLINECLKYDVQPMITLYHFDMPQTLQDLGGWANPLSVQWFEDYARIVFDKYANKVKYWVTINQPNTICIEGYGGGIMAPGINGKDIGNYLCIKNILLAHAKVYRLYEKEYKTRYQGFVGLSIALNWFDPINNKTANVEAANKAREFQFGLYVNPIWSKEGDFPTLVKEIVAKKSIEADFSSSRLPKLSPEELKLLKGSADFLGMNHYTTFLVKPTNQKYDFPSFEDDVGVDYSQGEEWRPGKSSWLKSAPYGIYKACIYINKQYDYPTIIITEHGWSSDPGLKDTGRVQTIKEYLGALLLAMEDGTEVKGYAAWSLMDNIEWTAGTSERFGLYEVDFNSENKNRTARLSAVVYKHIIESRVVDDEWRPKSLKISITNTSNKIKSEL